MALLGQIRDTSSVGRTKCIQNLKQGFFKILGKVHGLGSLLDKQTNNHSQADLEGEFILKYYN